MPRGLDKIREEQNKLEKEMKSALSGLANMLRSKESCLIQSDRPKELASNKELEINNEPEIKNEPKIKNKVENKIELYDIKFMMPNHIDTVSIYDFNKLDHMIEELLKKAYDDAGNTLLSNTKYLISYLDMRKLQIGVLKDISTNIDTIPVILKQTFPITDFLENISESFHEMNNVEGLLLHLREVQEHYRKEELPKTREEFEYRATLFQILKELEYFLLIKRNFVLQLEPEDRNTYWRKER
jgi:uncharacterized membrane protein YgaE (UPF0421/DUF939 family)